MKPHTAALDTYIAEGNKQVVLVDLFTFALVNGSALRFIEYSALGLSGSLTIPSANFGNDSLLNYAASGNRVFARGPRFARSKTSQKVGLEPTECDIAVYAGPNDLIGSVTWQEAVRARMFDGAQVEVGRLFLKPTAANGWAGLIDVSLGAILWFYGFAADVDSGRTGVMIKVKSPLNLLAQQQMPRRIFGSVCTHVFGGPMCGYNRVLGKNALGTSTGAGAVTVTALSGSSQSDIVLASGVAGYYGLGSCIGVTGANAGITVGIVSVATPTIVGLADEFPFPVAPGDTFQLLPGCDHTENTCNSVFKNLQSGASGGRFGGFDRIPPPEVAL